MRPYREPLGPSVTFFAVLSWAGCITNMSGFDLRQAQVGHLEKNADGKLAITRVDLRPKITWGGDRKPSAEELDKMHHAAHKNCFVANSVRTVVTVTKL